MQSTGYILLIISVLLAYQVERLDCFVTGFYLSMPEILYTLKFLEHASLVESRMFQSNFWHPHVREPALETNTKKYIF